MGVEYASERSHWAAGLGWEEAGMEAPCSPVARTVPWAEKWVERMRLHMCCKDRMCCHADGREAGRPGG